MPICHLTCQWVDERCSYFTISLKTVTLNVCRRWAGSGDRTSHGVTGSSGAVTGQSSHRPPTPTHSGSEMYAHQRAQITAPPRLGLRERATRDHSRGGRYGRQHSPEAADQRERLQTTQPRVDIPRAGRRSHVSRL